MPPDAWQVALAAVLTVAGTFFLVTGTVGILRLPDAYTRLHATAKADSLGSGLCLLGMALISGSTATATKLVLLTLFIWITAPTAAHSMARATYRSGIPPVPGTRNAQDRRGSDAAGRPG